MSDLANALGISTCYGMLVFTHTHTQPSVLCLTAVCVCHLSASDRFIVAEQQCLVLSLMEPVFSPVGLNQSERGCVQDASSESVSPSHTVVHVFNT